MTGNQFEIGLGRGINLFNTLCDGVRAFGDPKVVPPFPPYDLIQLSENEFSIHVALAGFSAEDINIQLQDRVLTVSATRSKEPEGKYLQRGIAGRSFEKRFELGNYVEVDNATFKDGLLKLALVRRVPEEKQTRKITIVTNDAASPAPVQAAE